MFDIQRHLGWQVGTSAADSSSSYSSSPSWLAVSKISEESITFQSVITKFNVEEVRSSNLKFLGSWQNQGQRTSSVQGLLWGLLQHFHIEQVERGCLCIFQSFQIQGRRELKEFHMCEWFHFSKMIIHRKTTNQGGEKEHIERNVSNQIPNWRTYVLKWLTSYVKTLQNSKAVLYLDDKRSNSSL